MELLALVIILLLIFVLTTVRQIAKQLNFLSVQTAMLTRQLDAELPQTFDALLSSYELDAMTRTIVKEALKSRRYKDARKTLAQQDHISNQETAFILSAYHYFER